MSIYVLRKKKADWGYGEYSPQWENTGYTTDIEVVRQWIQSSTRDEQHDHVKLKEITLSDIS